MQAGKKPAKTQEVIDHLGHVDYPVTGRQFIAACNSMSDVPKEQKEWVKQNISEAKSYSSSEELKKDLKL
jgi:hypothetical protein